MYLFANRQQAGELLAKLLINYTGKANTLILALPRGGVPVAYAAAQLLALPFDIFIVRKLGVPGQVELALGALAYGDILVFNRAIIQNLKIAKPLIEQTITEQKAIIAARNKIYRQDRPPLLLTNKTIILIDDGLATGATMRAAIKAIKVQQPAQIIVAVPIAPASVCQQLAKEVEQVLCLHSPEPFYNVGRWYRDFTQTTDAEVIRLLNQAAIPQEK